jgi:hypothetical protein
MQVPHEGRSSLSEGLLGPSRYLGLAGRYLCLVVTWAWSLLGPGRYLGLVVTWAWSLVACLADAASRAATRRRSWRHSVHTRGAALSARATICGANLCESVSVRALDSFANSPRLRALHLCFLGQAATLALAGM